jgi:hypothetical protein
MTKDEALKLAKEMHERAQNEGSAELFDAAGNMYQKAGMTGKANQCWDAADKIREGDA